MFKNSFFPPALNADLNDINNFTYAEPLTLTKSINKNEVNNAIAKLKADKAFETDQILNRMLKMLRETMTKRLIFIYQACIDVEYHSKSFREAKTIVFKKVEKSDYISFKVYRSIVLLNTMSKMLKSIMINKITELAKKNLLLSELQVNYHTNLCEDSRLDTTTMILESRTDFNQSNNRTSINQLKRKHM